MQRLEEVWSRFGSGSRQSGRREPLYRCPSMRHPHGRRDYCRGLAVQPSTTGQTRPFTWRLMPYSWRPSLPYHLTQLTPASTTLLQRPHERLAMASVLSGGERTRPCRHVTGSAKHARIACLRVSWASPKAFCFRHWPPIITPDVVADRQALQSFPLRYARPRLRPVPA